MKHFLLLTLIPAVLLFAGCRKDNVDANSPEAGLSFNLTLDRMPVIETRAASTDADLKGYGFYLAGYHTDGNMESSVADAYPNVFDHDASDKQVPVPLVKMVGSAFTLKTIKWALSEMTYLSFFAWSQSKPVPVSGVTPQTTGIYAHTSTTLENGYPWIDIRNADVPTDQTDVVVSRSLDHQNDAVISAVDLDFQHILSKLSFKAKSSSKARITFTAVNLTYATNKVYKKARYTFSSEVTMFGAHGTFAEYHAGSGALNTSYPTMINGAEVALGSALLVPQALAAGDVSLEIRYRLSPNSGTVPGVEQTKILPFSAFAFEQGKNYVYTIDVQATGIFVLANPTIEPWNIAGTSLPVVPGPKSDALLLLDGYDSPYQHSDGKQYWLDRSGYNRHVELGTGFASYDAAKHGYVFNKASKGGVIPGMGSVSGLSVDVVSECTGTATDQQPFKFGGLYIQLPYSGIRVDWNYGSHVSWTASTRSEIDRQSFWSVTYGNSKAQIYNNAFLKAENTATISDKNLAINTLASAYDGRISYLKVTNNVETQQNIADNYLVLKERYNIKNGLPEIEGPKGNLRLLLDGRDVPYTNSDGKQYWLDRSGYNNHMLLTNVGGNGITTHNSTKNCYEFSALDGKRGSTLPLQTFTDATIELCSERTVEGTGTAPLGLSSVGALDNSALRLLTGYGSSSELSILSGGNSKQGVGAYIKQNIPSIMDKRLWTVVSSNSPNNITVYLNGISSGTQSMSLENRLSQFKSVSCDVIGLVGNIYYIRITAVAKTSAEVSEGHREIQKIFNY